jgi:transposase
MILFLKELRHHVRGKLILLWDGLSAHISRETKAYIATQRSWLTIERFPSYAPELNPVEYLWSSGKRREFANFCPDTPVEMRHQMRRYTRRVRQDQQLLYGFLCASKLYVRKC